MTTNKLPGMYYYYFLITVIFPIQNQYKIVAQTYIVYWHWQSKTEASKGCNYYLSDLKSDCNNGIK
jgi:hypothetical protein